MHLEPNKTFSGQNGSEDLHFDLRLFCFNRTTGHMDNQMGYVESVILSCVFCFTVVMNLWIIFLPLNHPALRNFSAYLIINCAVAAMITGTIAATEAIIGTIPRERRKISKSMCLLELFMMYQCESVSLFGMMGVILERYWMLAYPVAYINRKNFVNLCIMILTPWLIVFVLFSVPIFANHDKEGQKSYFTSAYGFCYSCFHDDDNPHMIIYESIALLVPVLVFSFYTLKILSKLRKITSSAIGCSEPPKEKIKTVCNELKCMVVGFSTNRESSISVEERIQSQHRVGSRSLSPWITVERQDRPRTVQSKYKEDTSTSSGKDQDTSATVSICFPKMRPKEDMESEKTEKKVIRERLSDTGYIQEQSQGRHITENGRQGVSKKTPPEINVRVLKGILADDTDAKPSVTRTEHQNKIEAREHLPWEANDTPVSKLASWAQMSSSLKNKTNRDRIVDSTTLLHVKTGASAHHIPMATVADCTSKVVQFKRRHSKYSRMQKRRMLFIALLVIISMSWLPYIFVRILEGICVEQSICNDYEVFRLTSPCSTIRKIAVWIEYLSATANALAFAFLHPNFRSAVAKDVHRFRKLIRWKKGSVHVSAKPCK